MQVYFVWHQTPRFLSRELCTKVFSSTHFYYILQKTAHTSYKWKNCLIFLKFNLVAIIGAFAERLLCRLISEHYRSRSAFLALLWWETLSFGTAVFRINSLSAKYSKLHIRLMAVSTLDCSMNSLFATGHTASLQVLPLPTSSWPSPCQEFPLTHEYFHTGMSYNIFCL